MYNFKKFAFNSIVEIVHAKYFIHFVTLLGTVTHFSRTNLPDLFGSRIASELWSEHKYIIKLSFSLGSPITAWWWSANFWDGSGAFASSQMKSNFSEQLNNVKDFICFSKLWNSEFPFSSSSAASSQQQTLDRGDTSHWNFHNPASTTGRRVQFLLIGTPSKNHSSMDYLYILYFHWLVSAVDCGG